MTLTARIISGILAYVMMFSPIGWKKGDNTEAGGVKEITVAQSGGDFKTIEEARDYIRTLNKSKYDGIEVTVKSGVYQITEAIEFTEEDTGTEKCPITYKGEDGAEIVGGAFLYAKDFTKSEGGLTKYFPEEARGKIVMADMTKFGITPDMINKALEDRHYNQSIPFFSADGERQTIAQFPDDWLHIEGADTYDKNGELIDVESSEAYSQKVNYGEQYAETVQSWSETLPVYIIGRFFHLWCPDDSKVFNISKTEPTVDIYFNGGHQPYKGGIMYFYNVPEELDKPGEYIYDRNGMLYYYPTEDFETAEFTVPLSNGLVKMNGADYITFDNLVFSTTLGHGMEIKGNHITIKNCEICCTGREGIRADGDAFLLDSSSVHHTTDDGITLNSGDVATLTGGGSRIYNCDIYEFGLCRSYGYAITASGVDLLVDHNDVHDGDFKGIHFSGAVNAIGEYNDVWNVQRLSEDCGTMSTDGRQNANIIYRYNYVHDCYPEEEASTKIIELNPDYGYYGSFAFYYDGGSSYVQAYGNVIDGADNGYLSNGGRGNTFIGNLVMNCRKWYVIFSECSYSEQLKDGACTRSTKFDDYVYNDTWKKINPDLAACKTSHVGIDPLDPLFWAAPTGCVCRDNYIVFNKADRIETRFGIKPYNIEHYVDVFSGENMEYDQQPNEIYSSKRTTLDLEQVFKNAADTIDITWEQFRQIGRVSD